MLEHEWREADARCKHCGTPKALYDAEPGKWACVPHDEVLRPEPNGERQYAVYDFDAIYAKSAELQVERDAALNHVEE